MTISDAAPHWPPRVSTLGGGATPPFLLGVENSVDFVIGPGTSPVEAMGHAGVVAGLALPRMLEGAPDVDSVSADALAVLTELVDVTARHGAGNRLVARLAYDGGHVTVSVGDMDRTLPAPEEEPGLYLVHRVASEVGQYAGDQGGRVTWAAVSVGA